MAESDPTGSASGRLLIVSNRLPISVSRGADGAVDVERTVGGLATGLSKPHQESGGLWIGWSGRTEPLDADESAAFEDGGFVPVELDEPTLDGYYHETSNRCLWPLLHGFMERMAFDEDAWRTYVDVNRRFADTILERAREGDLVFVQDFHLALVPEMLRAEAPWLKIGFFLHIPFPAPDVYRMLPRRAAVLEGLLGADVIGFHATEYARNFQNALSDFLGLRVEGGTIRRGGRLIEVVAEPLGIDVDTWDAGDMDAEIEAEMEDLRRDIGDRHMILGVERLDYTKGIPHRIKAFRDLLEEDPTRVEDMVFYQIAVPSRQEVEDYAALHEEVTLLVGETNARFGRVGRQPIQYQYHGVPRPRLIALYRLADVCMVTPLRDGLNLVAKEYVAARPEPDGAIVLSEFAGVAAELQEALIVNPFDPTEMSAALLTAVRMPAAERARRMAGMRERVRARTIGSWTDAMLDRIRAAEPARTAAPLEGDARDRVLARVASSPRRTILLDYDGTLREFTDRPEDARPTPEILRLVDDLQATPGTQVWIISGRDAAFLGAEFGNARVGLIAEHGAFVRWPFPGDDDREGGDFDELLDIGHSGWREASRALMEAAAERLSGSAIEEKRVAIAFHWRRSDEAAGGRISRSLLRELRAALAHQPVEVMPGNKVIEVRPRGVSKAAAVRRLLDSGRASLAGTIVAGDDVTDETMFEALGDDCPTVLVGARPTAAGYRVADPPALRAFLAELAEELARPSTGSDRAEVRS